MRTKVILLFIGASVAELLLLEGTIGLSLPFDRYSARSTAAIEIRGRDDHYITRNSRFYIVDVPRGSHADTLVLKESVVTDRQPGAEGSGVGSVSFDVMVNQHVLWSLHEPGPRGDVVTERLYRVTKYGCCDAPSTYTYFSLRTGKKLLTRSGADLKPEEIGELDHTNPL